MITIQVICDWEHRNYIWHEFRHCGFISREDKNRDIVNDHSNRIFTFDVQSENDALKIFVMSTNIDGVISAERI